MNITASNIGYNGRLGNQMFQFAQLLGVGKWVGAKVVIPEENLFIAKTQRLSDGNTVSVKLDIFDCFKIDTVKHNVHIAPSSVFERLKFRYHAEQSFEYSKQVFDIKDDTNFVGYFQSEKYFKDMVDVVDVFQFQEWVKAKGDAWTRRFAQSMVNVAFIHLRCGDYLAQPQNHPVCGEDYYQRAMKMMNAHHYLVFSDDVECAKKIFVGPKFTICDVSDPFVSLYLMTQCNHGGILANSTFSWWGAYLNRDEISCCHTRFIAPKQWFGSAIKHDTKDLIPREWETI